MPDPENGGQISGAPPGNVTGAPLANVRVVAVEQYGAGPWGTMQLADLGAEVIKVEDPEQAGDVGRYVPPYQAGEDSLFFESFNRGKRSVSLNLRHADGRAAFEDLVASADALFSNLRGDAAGRLRLRYADLRHVNDRLVCCSLSAFGMDGPRAGEGGYDFTVQGLAGWQSLTGGPTDPPMRSGLSLVDFSAGYVAALAIIAAIWRARRDGVGGDVDLSLFEVALSQLNYVATWVASRGYEPMRRERSAHQSLVPFGNFPTADGWMVVACPKETLWRDLCRALDRRDWIEDPRFASFADRQRHREQLTALLDELFKEQPTAYWLDRLQSHRVPCAPINDVAAALRDPQALARGVIEACDHPRLGRIEQVRTPFRMDGVSGHVEPAPARGQDTVEVLSELCGYEPEHIADLVESGVAKDPR